MKRLLIFAALPVALLVGAFAFAETDTAPWKSIYEHFDFKVAARFRQNVNFDRSLAVTHLDAGAISGNGISITPTGRGTLNYDFPPITGTHSACAVAATTATVTGCTFGDKPLMGSDQTMGQSGTHYTLFPFVSAANTVSLQACATGVTDGGTADPPDASYYFTCID